MVATKATAIPFPTSEMFCSLCITYFNPRTQQELVERFYQQLEPGGYLFIGHSESLNRITHRFEYICPAVYKKPGTLRSTSSSRGGAA
jgi:chemotaxis protein methyltransferase CheR